MQTMPVSDDRTAEGSPRELEALSLRLLREWVERQGGMVSIKDASSGTYLHVSPAMAAWLGRDAEEVRGHSDAELLDADLAASVRAADQSALAQRHPLLSEQRIDWRGSRSDFQVLRLVSEPQGGGRRLLAALWTDLGPQRLKEAQLKSALEQLEQQQRDNEQLRRELRDQSLRDATTGLYTRAHFDDQLKREVDLSTREHREFAVVYIALDPLAESVAALGPAARTHVLEAMGRLLRGNTRAMDASCRLDEGRFGVLLSGVGLATAHSRMEGLRRQCATQIVMHDGQELGFTVSMGVASFPHTAHSEAELLEAGSKALEEAQRRGGNHVTLASIRFEG